MARRRRSDFNPLTKFINTTWFNINRRTVNGLHPNMISRGTSNYIQRGIRIEFTRTEFVAWCEQHRDQILATERPSIDRISGFGHYSLGNIQVLSLKAHRTKSAAEAHERAIAKHPVRHCLLCGKRFTIGRKEGAKKFARRKTCGVICLGKAMSAGLIHRGRAAVKHRGKAAWTTKKQKQQSFTET